MEEKSPTLLTRDQVNLLKHSFRALDAQRMGQRFYQKLFDQHPQLKPMFSTNIDDQVTKIISVLELVIFSFEEKSPNQFGLQESLLLPLRDLGSKHTQKGVEHAHYPIANTLLLQSIQEELGSILSFEGQLAWKLAIDHLSYAMTNTSITPPSTSARTLRESFSMIKKLIRF